MQCCFIRRQYTEYIHGVLIPHRGLLISETLIGCTDISCCLVGFAQFTTPYQSFCNFTQTPCYLPSLQKQVLSVSKVLKWCQQWEKFKKWHQLILTITKLCKLNTEGSVGFSKRNCSEPLWSSWLILNINLKNFKISFYYRGVERKQMLCWKWRQMPQPIVDCIIRIFACDF